ncbi:hypothetical protein TruAng_012128 [Truncatella angustata]|nr:hypothetical protein TruAng_012128 [Truncatella angustata]
MFGGAKAKKRRSSRQQPYPQLTRDTANPNASTAAAAAFMASSNPNPNKALSSAAAAAALRARPHTPTNVSQVQTKRTSRRSPSISSIGSAASAAARGSTQQPRLGRRGSSGSMSERSFRTRSQSPHGDRRPYEQDHPPVPAIPPGHKASKSMSSAGVGMQNFKTASQKLDSGLPSWYTQPRGDTSNVRTSDAPMRRGRPESITRADSRSSSINFSYPGRARAQSPPSSPTVDQSSQWSNSPKANRSSVVSNGSSRPDQTLVYDPNSRRMVPKASLEAVEYNVRAAAEKPTKSRKSQTGVSRSGSHLAKGTVARVKGTNVEPGGRPREVPRREQPPVETQYPSREETEMLDDLQAEAVVTTPQLPQKQRQDTRQARFSDADNSRLSTPSPIEQQPDRFASPRPTGQLGRHPSVVKEEPEEDPDAEASHVPSKEVYGALDNVPTRQTLYEPVHEQDTVLEPKPQSYGQPESIDFAENKQVASLARDDSIPQRSLSQSPARQARFASTPSESLVVRHAPLGRSASPIKSALKHHSPSPRDASPSDYGSDAARAPVDSPDRAAPVSRKKSVRVSFDERSPVVVGESIGPLGDTDSPVVPSPQTRRPWYSSIGRKKKEASPELDDDEVMKPRPALPSFGSVREKKVREPEEPERPLIRPHELAHSPTPPTSSGDQQPLSPSQTKTIDEYAASTVSGQSSDHAVGSILAQNQDSASRNAANISRFREPLPPIVTSAEAHEDFSDSMRSSDDEFVFDSAVNDSDGETVPGTQTTATTMMGSQVISENGLTGLEEDIPEVAEQPKAQPGLAEYSQNATTGPTETVPAIMFTQPSPAAIDENRVHARQPARDYMDLPGMFPDDESDDYTTTQQRQTLPNPTPASAIEAVKELEPVVAPSQTQVLPQTNLATTPQATMPEDTTDDESNASIYSDAYEDPSDMEGDGGFQSLDAVVESPVTKTSLADQIPKGVTGEKSNLEDMNPVVQKAVVSTQVAAPSNPETDWEQAKSFWRGLTAEKRRQLELEAMDEAGTEADQEELKTPTRKLSNRGKKTAEQRQATAVGRAAQAQAAAPVQEPRQMKGNDPERTYMIQPGTKADHGPVSPQARSSGPIRTSLRREEPQSATSGHMRTSLRGDQAQSGKSRTLSKSNPGEVHMRKSMRSGGTEPASRRISQQPERVASPPTITTRPRTAGGPERGAQRDRSSSFEVAASAAAAIQRNGKPAPIQRRGSDASDSSFKRARAAPSDHISFRRTMRHDAAPAQPQSSEIKATKGSGRFSLRSLSPSGSAFRRSSVVTASPQSKGMRQSLRSGSDVASIASRDSKRTSLVPSFGRASGKVASKKIKSESRFVDSSDEDEPASSRFRSRFDDSSDEDDARPSASDRPLSKGTLRGSATAPANFKKATTPVPEEDEDSPDLPDSDDEPSMQLPSPLRSPGNTAAPFRPDLNKRYSSGIGTTTLGRPQAGRGTSYTAPSTERPTHARRGSFMSNILRRNRKADNAKTTRSETAGLDHNTDELTAPLGDSRPTSPRLQKKNPYESWPLPEAGEDGRPSTSGGRLNGAGSKRPEFAGRRSTSLGLPEQHINGNGADYDISAGADHTKKKKKFGTLRKIFGLDD